MAQAFNLTAQLQLQAPGNTNQVINQIRKQLKPIGVQVNIQNAKNIAQANKSLSSFNKNAQASTKSMNQLNRTLQESARRFSVITIATGSFLALANAFKKSAKEAVAFERELVKISQVTGKTVAQLGSLSNEVTRLGTSLGASSADLLNVARTLTQAGFAAEDTRKALDILAKTSLGATFNNIQDTTEGAIALLRQFQNEAQSAGGNIKFLEQSLDAINAVSKRFAVESGDLITAIRRTGGVFSAAGGSVNELIALFTSVRATTRESAETIATGLRTIFTRIQRPESITQLREFGIELQDAQGNFVGAFEAFKRLSAGLKSVDPRTTAFSQIVEDLGGFRQVGKVIPLIQQFTTAQQALSVAQSASGSVAKDAETAQQSLGVQIQKVREQFDALIRKFVDSSAFRSLATGGLELAKAFIRIADALEPLLPLLVTLAGLKLGKGLAPALGSFVGIGKSVSGAGPVTKFARGGMVPGSGNRDTVPAMLTPGEFVIKKSSVNKIGAGKLAAMNENRYANGGVVDVKDPKKYAAFVLDSASGSDLAASELGSKLSSTANKRIDQLVGRAKAIKSLNADEYKQLTGVTRGKSLPPRGRPQKKILQEAYESQYGKKASDEDLKIFAGINRVTTKKGEENSYSMKGPFPVFGIGSNASIQQDMQKEFRKASDAAIKRGAESISPFLENRLNIGGPLNFANDQFDLEGVLEGARPTVEGYILEAVVGAVSGAKVGASTSSGTGIRADFDLPGPITSDQKEKLINLFNPNDDLSAVVKGDVKRARSTAAAGDGALVNKIAKDLSRQDFVLREPLKKAKGGGISGSDTVPALLTPGEFVFSKSAAQSIGYNNLNRMNKQGVQGYAKGGAVGIQTFANGTGPNGVTGGNAFDPASVGVLDDFISKLEEAANQSEETTQSKKRLADATDKVQKGVAGFQQKLSKFQGIAQSAQQFVFLGASVTALAGQFGGLEDATARALSETAGFVTAIVGIGGTLAELVISVTGSISSNAAFQGAIARSIAAINAEAGARLKALGAGGDGLPQQGRLGKIGNVLAGFAVGLTVAVSALKFFSARAEAIADEMREKFNKGLQSIGEGTAVDNSALVNAVRTEAAERTKSAAALNKVTVGYSATTAALGAGIGQLLIPIPILGAAIGGVIGGLVGYVQSTRAADEVARREAAAREANLAALGSELNALTEFNQAIVAAKGKLEELSLVSNLSEERQVEIRSGALGDILGTNLATTIGTAQAQQRTIAGEAGLTRQEFAGLDDDAIVAKFAELGKDAGDAAIQIARFKTATALNESAQKELQFAVGESIKNFEQSLGQADPSKTFQQILSEGGAVANAFNLAKQASEAKAKADLLAAEENLALAKSTGASPETVKGFETALQSARDNVQNAGALFLEAAEASQAIRNAEQAAFERQDNAARALYESTIRTAEALGGFKNALEAQKAQGRALASFNTVATGGLSDVRAASVTETEITPTLDIAKFEKETQAVLDTIVDPTLKKQAEEIRDRNIEAAKAVQKLGEDFLSGPGNLQNANLDYIQKLLPESIFKEFKAKLEEFSSTESGSRVDVQELEELQSILQKYGQQGAEIYSLITDTNQQYLNNYKTWLGQIEKQQQEELAWRTNLYKLQEEAANSELRARNIINRFLEKDPEMKDRAAARARETSRANFELRAAGATSQAGDINALAAERQRLDLEKKRLDEESKTASDARQQEILVEQAKAEAALKAVNRELGRLSNQSDAVNDIFAEMENNASVIQKEIEERKKLIEVEKRAREQMFSVLEDFVVGGPEDRQRLGQAAMGVQAAFATGTLQNQSAEQRRATVGLLDQLSDVELFGGFTGKEIKQELVLRDAIKMGFPPEIARQIATATTKEQQLIDQVKDLKQKLVDVNTELLHQLEELNTNMKDAAEAQQPNNQVGDEPQKNLARGGLVQYRAGGGTIFQPKGTDTVPAMLTPGEFVIRKSAVDSIGVGTLQALNNGGGVVYASDGRLVKKTEDESTLELIRDNLRKRTQSGNGPNPYYSGVKNEQDILKDLKSQGYRGGSSRIRNKDIQPVSGDFGAGADDKILDFFTLFNEEFVNVANSETRGGDKRLLDRKIIGEILPNVSSAIASGVLKTGSAVQGLVDITTGTGDVDLFGDRDEFEEMGKISRRAADAIAASKASLRSSTYQEVLRKESFLQNAPKASEEEIQAAINAANQAKTQRQEQAKRIAANNAAADKAMAASSERIQESEEAEKKRRKLLDDQYNEAMASNKPTMSSEEFNRKLDKRQKADGSFYKDKADKMNAGFGTMGGGDVEDSFTMLQMQQEKAKALADAQRAVDQTIPGSTAYNEAKRKLEELQDPNLAASNFKADQKARQDAKMSFGGSKAAKARRDAANAGFVGPLRPGETGADQGRDNASTRRRRRLADQRSAARGESQRKEGQRQSTEEKQNRARYERILRTQGQAAAQRYAKTAGINTAGEGLIRSFAGYGRNQMMRGGYGNQMMGGGYGGGMLPFGYIPGSPYNNMLGRGGYNIPRFSPYMMFGNNARFFNSGGAAGGDTVPAMLTPGEFVMSKNAVSKYGTGFMQKLNRGKIQGYNRGGPVQYRQTGGIMDMLGGAAQSLGIDTSKIEGVFSGFVDNFSSVFDNILGPFNAVAESLRQMSQSFGNFTMQHNVNVEGMINIGGLNIESLKTELSQYIADMVKGEIDSSTKRERKLFRSN